MTMKPIRNDDDLKAVFRRLEIIFQAEEQTAEADERDVLVNRPGFHGGWLVKVNPGFRSSRQVAESSLPQPRPVEYTQWAPAVGGG